MAPSLISEAFAATRNAPRHLRPVLGSDNVTRLSPPVFPTFGVTRAAS